MLAEGPGVADEKNFEFFLAYYTPPPLMSVQQNFSPIGPAVWPAIHNIYRYIRMSWFII